MKFELSKFLTRYEKFIPLALFLAFLLVTVPGISWGAPALWNPDELVWRVTKALDGELKFDENEPDFNYPSLPKYVMYGVGWLVEGVGGSETDVIVSARLVSVLLGGLTVILIYLIASLASKNIYVRLLAAFLALSNPALAHNARFAHNDLYLLFFITLSLYAILKYVTSQKGGESGVKHPATRFAEENLKYQLFIHRPWLYLAFFAAGCAASSKYTGATFVIILVLIYLISNWNTLFKDWLRAGETLFIAAALTVAGYVVGTPKALLWMSFYFKRMIPAALRFASYGRGPESLIGLYGQWATFREAVGMAAYILYLVAFLWGAVKLSLYLTKRMPEEQNRMNVLFVLLIAIVLFDIPFLISYNYVPRFFLPFLPMFAVLASMFVEDLVSFAGRREYPVTVPFISIAVVLVILVSYLQVFSVALLFANDARTQAGKFIETLRPDTILEYTLYPPDIPENHFERTRNYPIYMIKYPGETVPTTGKAYQYNQGERGLYERDVNYLVIDSFTYARFEDGFVCQTNPVECRFFRQLLAGETDLRMLASFEYRLPPFLPQISLAAVNPDVKIYEVPRR
jgi:Dolichyl-phosphate-mannose-protein mannosyltransferase